jgi:uncharacterized membrane protein
MICAILILATISSYAAINVVPPAVYDSGIIPAINNVSPGDAIGTIISWMIGLTAVLTVLAVTWAGVQMILATGEEEKFKKARYIMIYAFI